MNEWLERLGAFVLGDDRIEAVIVVGSYARGTNREDSDLDVVMITTDKAAMVEHPDFTERFGTIARMQTEYYGACTSIRVWYENGPEVEFGLVEPSWLAEPLDAGTHRVLSDGYRVIVDKKGSFEGLRL